jgi:hypothetical protein
VKGCGHGKLEKRGTSKGLLRKDLLKRELIWVLKSCGKYLKVWSISRG